MKVDHTVGPVVSGRLQGPNVSVEEEAVAAGAVTLSVRRDDRGERDGRGWRVDPDGDANPEQVLRALYTAGVIDDSGSADDRLRVRFECRRGSDQAVYSADLQHRLVYRRVYDPDRPVATWVGLNPFLSDLEGDPARTPPRPSMRNAVGALTNDLGPLGTLNILNLFTRRSHTAADLDADDGARLVHDGVVREALAASDVVLPAWGSKVKERHLPQVRRLLDLADDLGLPDFTFARQTDT